MAAPPVDAIAPESLLCYEPPLLAREALVGATRPLLDAGDYLGGGMGGQQPFNPAEATQEAVKLGSAFAGPKLGAGVIAGALAPGLRAVERAAPELEQAAAQGIRAFHGSPHDFDAFSMDKIGTGEGAQAYGHGSLFCGSGSLSAKGYRDQLASDTPEKRRWTESDSLATLPI